MLKQLPDTKSKNTILHIPKLLKNQNTMPLGPLRLSSLGNSISHQNQKPKDKFNLINDSQRLLATLKKQELNLLLHNDLSSRLSDVEKLIDMLLTKKFGSGGKLEESGLRDSMLNSVCLKMICNNVLQELQKKGRLGADLKGINKKILAEIENQVGEAMNKEVKLFESKTEFSQGCAELTAELKVYKQKILESLENLKAGDQNQ